MTNGMTVTLIVVFMAAAAFVVYGLIACKSRALRRVLEGFPEKPRVRSVPADTLKRTRLHIRSILQKRRRNRIS